MNEIGTMSMGGSKAGATGTPQRRHNGEGVPVIRLTRAWSPPTREAQIRARILAKLETDTEWRRATEGRWLWSTLRQTIGGKVRRAEFRTVMDGLEEGGLVVEALEGWGDRRAPRHWVVLADHWDEFRWGELIEVRGRSDVLRRLGLPAWAEQQMGPAA